MLCTWAGYGQAMARLCDVYRRFHYKTGNISLAGNPAMWGSQTVSREKQQQTGKKSRSGKRKA